LLHATGSKPHLDALATLARDKGLLLDQTGLYRGRKIIARKSETDIYEALGLPFIEPELREGADEIALALEDRLPPLVADKDIRGILHAHTDRSDGVDTLEAMAEATRTREYQYFGIADHSKSAHYARLLRLSISACCSSISSIESPPAIRRRRDQARAA
jgi:DNA polymerase (family 10)